MTKLYKYETNSQVKMQSKIRSTKLIYVYTVYDCSYKKFCQLRSRLRCHSFVKQAVQM